MPPTSDATREHPPRRPPARRRAATLGATARRAPGRAENPGERGGGREVDAIGNAEPLGLATELFKLRAGADERQAWRLAARLQARQGGDQRIDALGFAQLADKDEVDARRRRGRSARIRRVEPVEHDAAQPRVDADKTIVARSDVAAFEQKQVGRRGEAALDRHIEVMDQAARLVVEASAVRRIGGDRGAGRIGSDASGAR